MLVCEQHYEGAKHNRKIAAELEKFHQARPFLFSSSLIINFILGILDIS